jgi:hypothetical protein
LLGNGAIRARFHRGHERSERGVLCRCAR